MQKNPLPFWFERQRCEKYDNLLRLEVGPEGQLDLTVCADANLIADG